MGSVASVITVMLLLAVRRSIGPFHPGVGGLEPVAMERSLRLLDDVLPSLRPGTRCRATTGADRSEREGAQRPRRARRDRPARARDGRDGVERLPGEPLERETTKATMRGNAARLRVDARVRPRERPGADRRRGLHAVGRRLRVGQDRSSRDFYFERFRPEFKPAVVAWLATRPLKNPKRAADAVRDAAVHVRRRATRRRGSTPQADAWAATARRNVQRSTNYVLGVVMFAAALFFAGMSTKLPSRAAGRRDARDRHRHVHVPRSSGS